MPDPRPEAENAKVLHSGYIDIELDGYHRAHCCCDWEGQLRLTMSEAGADLAKHYSEVAP